MHDAVTGPEQHRDDEESTRGGCHHSRGAGIERVDWNPREQWLVGKGGHQQRGQDQGHRVTDCRAGGSDECRQHEHQPESVG